MGMFGDKLLADYHGVKIEAEGTATLLGGQFRLIVDGQKLDEGPVNMGAEMSLVGVFQANGGDRKIRLQVKQGMLGTKFTLLVDGAEHPIQRTK